MTSIINKTLQHLHNQDVILYPTDTVWGLGCDATSPNAVQRIFEIKKRVAQKSLILLVSDIEMLKQYVCVPSSVLAFLETQHRPTSVIYSNPKNLAFNTIAHDNTVAIRIVQEPFCKQLIASFKKPIVSTSANISGFPTPCFFSEIDDAIKQSVDFIVPLYQDKKNDNPPSQLVKIEENGNIIFLRK